jgi:phosphate transport system substrate-binding protein
MDQSGERSKGMSTKTMSAIVIIAILIVGIAGYVYLAWKPQAPSPGGLSGTIEIDGSSTVFPITEAVAEEFRKINPDVRVNVGISGTGGGFKRFTVGETDISDASRPIKKSEAEGAQKNGIEYIELRVAVDGLTVVVNKGNNWVDYLTVQELKRIWEPNSTVQKWSDVRPSWPDRPITLYGPGTDSGTFDYFTEVIVGKEDASRPDYTASEDDNVLVQGIAGDPNSLGYFGFAYYAENMDKLKVVPIDSGKGPVTPSDVTVRNGQYAPLSRPLFIYVNTKSMQRPEVKAFVIFYLGNAEDLVAQVGYTPLEASVYQEQLIMVRSRFP